MTTRPAWRTIMDWLNPIEWVAWLYGRFFPGHTWNVHRYCVSSTIWGAARRNAPTPKSAVEVAEGGTELTTVGCT
jgi:hypothetical protein